MSGLTAYQRPSRNRFFRDRDGIPSVVRDEDAVETYTLDYADELGSDTISTSTWASEGPTIDSDSNTTTATTVTVSGSSGELKNTVVTAGGRTLIRYLNEYQAEKSSDYRA